MYCLVIEVRVKSRWPPLFKPNLNAQLFLGELFGKMKLGSSLSEDTSAGRLVLTNCSSLLLTKPNAAKSDSKRKAFVSVIEDTGKSTLYLRYFYF